MKSVQLPGCTDKRLFLTVSSLPDAAKEWLAPFGSERRGNMFVGRERELASLNHLYASDKFEFAETAMEENQKP